MILYEYICECGEVYEVYQGITENRLTSMYCPKCGTIKPVKRQVGSSRFKLKGSGWFRDGYTKEKKDLTK